MGRGRRGKERGKNGGREEGENNLAFAVSLLNESCRIPVLFFLLLIYMLLPLEISLQQEHCFVYLEFNATWH